MSIINKDDEEYIFNVIGQNIKKQRKIKGWTQQELANKCIYDLSFIGNLESKKVFQTISVSSVFHIAQVLGIHITKLFEDLEEDKQLEE